MKVFALGRSEWEQLGCEAECACQCVATAACVSFDFRAADNRLCRMYSERSRTGGGELRTATVPCRFSQHHWELQGEREAEAAGRPPALLIKGVLDLQTPERGSSGKGVELLAVETVPDLSRFGVGVANNGGGTDGVEVDNLPNISLAAGSSFWVLHQQAVDRAGTNPYAAYFGGRTVFAVGRDGVDFHVDTDISQNGDDAVELFYGDEVVDVYGSIEVDGTGQPWEYRDAWAYRADSVVAPRAEFRLEEWSVAAVDCSDGSTTNCDSGCGPYPAFADCSRSHSAPSHVQHICAALKVYSPPKPESGPQSWRWIVWPQKF